MLCLPFLMPLAAQENASRSPSAFTEEYEVKIRGHIATLQQIMAGFDTLEKLDAVILSRISADLDGVLNQLYYMSSIDNLVRQAVSRQSQDYAFLQYEVMLKFTVNTLQNRANRVAQFRGSVRSPDLISALGGIQVDLNSLLADYNTVLSGVQSRGQ
ncbi:MAG: hypothetical protein KDI06_19495 [Calditrichaeota bacterium]|nr:hypothetical protein [Calditrichota bacterium]HQU73561.1 hypothetical protein [Calditrichia bacterium]